MVSSHWQFWIDRGGTFTDIVAQTPTGEILIHKLLSENPEQYEDALIQGIREVMGIDRDETIPVDEIEVIKMGTTVATNALLERKGDRVVLVTTKGFKDALRIGYQNRPNIFALEIILPEMLCERVIEINERYNAPGEELIPVDTFQAQQDLQAAYDEEIRSCAIVLMHSYRYPNHELEVADIAREIGFTQISVSHQVSPLIKFVSRGDTTVVDAYLSPILRRYVEQFTKNLKLKTENSCQLMFMQSNGGLVDAHLFQGKDSILSGPAGGIVGAVKTSALAGFEQIIGFDMGGTSTDVSHYGGEYERSLETEVAGVRLRSPMMSIHTVAAGGGSILHFDGSRYRVGPDSAGANPGAAAYGRGGELTVTDCNVMVGKLQPEFFPQVFGLNADAPLDTEIVRTRFQALANVIQDGKTCEQIAAGFLAIAVENMANAIKKISLQKGYDKGSATQKDREAIRLLRQHGILSLATWVTDFEEVRDRDFIRSLKQLLWYDPDQIMTLYVTPHRWTSYYRLASDRQIIQLDQRLWDYKHQVLKTVNMPPWRIFLWVKFIELILQARPKAIWRSYFQSDRAARHGMNWFTRMGRRVLIHEWWNFWFCDRRIQDGVTLKQFWGAPQDDREVPLRLKSQPIESATD